MFESRIVSIMKAMLVTWRIWARRLLMTATNMSPAMDSVLVVNFSTLRTSILSSYSRVVPIAAALSSERQDFPYPHLLRG
jgi:hypothetical protein